MKENKTEINWKKSIMESLKDIAITKRIATSFNGVPEQEVDRFISEKGNEIMNLIGSVSERRLLAIMLDDILMGLERGEENE